MKIVNLQIAMGITQGQAPCWGEVLAELWAIISCPLTAQAEKFLLEIMEFSRELQLDETAAMPHRCSPERMLKSLSAQAICRWTGLRHLYALRQLQQTTPSLAREIDSAIEKAVSHPDGDQNARQTDS